MGCASNSTEIKNTQSEKENKQSFGRNQKEIETSTEQKKENKQQVENIQKEEKYNKPFIPGAYLYTIEEQNFIQKMYEESRGKEDKNQLLFYKQVIKRNKKITNHKEIFTLKKKATNNSYDHFYFKSPSIKARDANVISRYYFTKNEKISMTSELIMKQYIWHDFLIFYSDSNEDQLLTFEIITEYQTPVHKMLTFIPFDLQNDKDKKIEYDITNCKKIKINIEYAACFSFLGMNNDNLYLKNLKKKWEGPCAPIEYEGSGLEYYVFNFSYVNFNIALEHGKPHLYCYDFPEINKLNQAIQNIKFNSEETNVIGIKDFFSIKNKVVNVKSFIIFIRFRDYESINSFYQDTLFYYVEDRNNLKITKVKCNNQMNSSGTIMGHYLQLIYELKPKEYFCTVEVEYSYSLKCSGQYDTTLIGHDYMGEGFYYSLMINYDPNEYSGFAFLRNQNTYEFKKDKSEIKIENFYKSYNDKNPYESLHLLKI